MDDVVRIESTAALDEFLSASGSAPWALDTEADSFHHYREKVCLVQVTAGGRNALIDPLADVDLRRLAPVLADRTVRKILHGADYDVRLLRRDAGLAIAGLFDTMVAARLVGETALGLAALLAKFLGVEHDKSQQRADWSKRPLTDAMLRYAVEDTRHLESLAGLLAERLDAVGRAAWAEEEFLRLEHVTWRDARREDPEPFRRVKGSGALDAAALAVLREVWGWREAMAERRDRPPFRILRDEPLLHIARRPPEAVGDLAKIEGFPAPLLRSPAAHDLVAAARRGVACAEDERPALRPRTGVRPDAAVEAESGRLRGVRDALAKELALDPSVVASRGLLDEVARRRVAGEDPWGAPELRDWQRGLLRERAGTP